ncbi:MAG: hypothetical protein DYG94_12040 [Leptolyngbya sp. PLA3]|nr:hypothetical protein [Leptolyngbya sp. PL-A3]
MERRGKRHFHAQRREERHVAGRPFGQGGRMRGFVQRAQTPDAEFLPPVPVRVDLKDAMIAGVGNEQTRRFGTTGQPGAPVHGRRLKERQRRGHARRRLCVQVEAAQRAVVGVGDEQVPVGPRVHERHAGGVAELGLGERAVARAGEALGRADQGLDGSRRQMQAAQSRCVGVEREQRRCLRIKRKGARLPEGGGLERAVDQSGRANAGQGARDECIEVGQPHLVEPGHRDEQPVARRVEDDVRGRVERLVDSRRTAAPIEPARARADDRAHLSVVEIDAANGVVAGIGNVEQRPLGVEGQPGRFAEPGAGGGPVNVPGAAAEDRADAGLPIDVGPGGFDDAMVPRVGNEHAPRSPHAGDLRKHSAGKAQPAGRAVAPHDGVGQRRAPGVRGDQVADRAGEQFAIAGSGDASRHRAVGRNDRKSRPRAGLEGAEH